MPMHPIVSAYDKQHTTLPNSSLIFFKITVAKRHPLLKIVHFSSRKLYISQKSSRRNLSLFDVSALFTSIPVPVALHVINCKFLPIPFHQYLQDPYRKIPKEGDLDLHLQ